MLYHVPVGSPSPRDAETRSQRRLYRSNSAPGLVTSDAQGVPTGTPSRGTFSSAASLLQQPDVSDSGLSQEPVPPCSASEIDNAGNVAGLSRWSGLSNLSSGRTSLSSLDTTCSEAEDDGAHLARWLGLQNLSRDNQIAGRYDAQEAFQAHKQSLLTLASSLDLSVIEGCDCRSSLESLADDRENLLQKPASLRFLRSTKSEAARIDGVAQLRRGPVEAAAPDDIVTEHTRNLQQDIAAARVRAIRSVKIDGVEVAGTNFVNAVEAVGDYSADLSEVSEAVSNSASLPEPLLASASELSLTGGAQLAVEAVGTIANSAIITYLAQSKLNKVKRRRQAIENAYTIKAEREKELSSQMPAATPEAENLAAHDVFADTGCEDSVNWLQFRQYAELCFLEGEMTSNPLADILKQQGGYLSPLSLFRVIVDSIKLSDEKIGINTPLLMEFMQHLKDDPASTYRDQKQLKSVNKALAPLGITIGYETDKLFGSMRKGAAAIGHKLEVNKERLYEALVLMDKLPTVSSMDRIIHKYYNVIDALYSVRTYDRWKQHQHKVDRDLKLVATGISALPIATGIDEVLKAAAYGREIKYRQGNENRALDRLSYALGYVKTFGAGWTQDELESVTRLLSSVEKVKEAHMDIKKAKLGVYVGAHSAAAVIEPLSNLIGPVGTAITSSVKTTSKNIAAVTAAANRVAKEKTLRQQGDFAESKDVYDCYKKLYLAALDEFNFEKLVNLQNLASYTFGMSPASFDALVKTELVETGRFKPSFSHKPA